MAFFRSLSDTSGPADVFTKYPEIYGPWADTGQALMNGPSPLTPGEREMIAAYVVGVAKCDYAYVAHCAAAYAWGIEEGLIDKLLNNLDAAPVENRFKPLLSYAAKLTSTPENINQADADAVFDAGWDEQGLHDTIAVTARMNFMCRLVQGHGFIPMSPEKARENAAKRVEKGYRNLYPEFMKE
ncbi:MAG: carboxymuconolactone decarboxylase family protein [Alphaproteobacteria bacterium]|nr:carboxymuconolactone decarboxylase family protein [Alphaproteobacteria bacterium]